MIINLNLAEERFASSVWEIPIFFAFHPMVVRSGIFIANHAIWGQGGVCRLTLLNRKNDQVAGFLTLEDDLPAFTGLMFEMVGNSKLEHWSPLTLVKEPIKERNLSLPFCMVQVELE